MALNIPAQQYLAKPVTSYYKGRAMRQAERAAEQEYRLGEQQEEMNRLKLDQAKNPGYEPPDPQDVQRVQDIVTERQQRTLKAYEAIRESAGDEEAEQYAQMRTQQDAQWLKKNYPWYPIQGKPEWNYQAVKAFFDEETEEGGTLVNLLPPGSKSTKDAKTFRRDDERVDELIGQGWQRIGVAQPQGTPEELMADPRTRSQRGAEEQAQRDRNRVAESNIGEIGLALSGIQGIDNPTGLRGAAGEFFGGLIGQVSESAGDEFTEWVTGADKAELSTVRTRAKTLAARLLPSITGEESGRFTEQERALATEVAGAIDVAQSKKQVASNLSELLAIELRGMFRDSRFQGDPPPVDLTTEQGLNDLGQKLEQMGMEKDKIIDTLIILEGIQSGERY